MTTTAEKICAWTEDESDIWETSCGNTFTLMAGTPKENQMRFCCYCGKSLGHIKPADHKPLECWGNLYADGTTVYFSDKSYAEDVAKQNNTTRIAVHMREVTPQDEQDRKDAARYREIKHLWDIENGME